MPKKSQIHEYSELHDPYIYWTHLKSRYEADNNPRKVHLIDQFVGCNKLNSVSMEEYLVEMKETFDRLIGRHERWLA
jgi:hypothetical protein